MMLPSLLTGQVWQSYENGRQVQVVAATGRWATVKVVKTKRGAQMPARKGVRSIARDCMAKHFMLIYDPREGSV
jgi:hypothetical protein